MAWSKEQYREKAKTKTACKNCGKMVNYSGMPKHLLTKKCIKHSNDKTTDRSNSPALTVSDVTPKTKTSSEAVSVESKSKILTEINLNGEFETMSEKVNSKKKDNDDGYEHSCGAKFKDKLKYCPGCGDELEA